MPRYLIQGAYRAEAAAAFASKPQDRVAGIRTLLERMGAQMDSFDYCLGDYDVMVTYTAPRRHHRHGDCPGDPRPRAPEGVQDDQAALAGGVPGGLAQGEWGRATRRRRGASGGRAPQERACPSERHGWCRSGLHLCGHD